MGQAPTLSPYPARFKKGQAENRFVRVKPKIGSTIIKMRRAIKGLNKGQNEPL